MVKKTHEHEMYSIAEMHSCEETSLTLASIINRAQHNYKIEGWIVERVTPDLKQGLPPSMYYEAIDISHLLFDSYSYEHCVSIIHTISRGTQILYNKRRKTGGTTLHPHSRISLSSFLTCKYGRGLIYSGWNEQYLHVNAIIFPLRSKLCGPSKNMRVSNYVILQNNHL